MLVYLYLCSLSRVLLSFVSNERAYHKILTAQIVLRTVEGGVGDGGNKVRRGSGMDNGTSIHQ
jgi:hypothetical protein